MAGQKRRTSRVSKGGRQRANLAKNEKRMKKFAAKRENGTAYEYKPNPYKKGSVEYIAERAKRAEKAKSSKLDIAQWDSTMSKLDNWIAAEKEKAAKAKSKKKAAA